MSEISDLIADVNDATNAVADKIDSQAAAIADLTAQLAAATPGSAEATRLQAEVTEAVDGFTALGSRLRGIAANPDEPVPPVADAPPVEGGTSQ